MTPKTNPKKGKKILVALLVIAVTAGIGLGIWQVLRNAQLAAAQATAETEGAYQTSTVKRGEIALTISGSGSMVITSPADLAFAVSGTIAELNVQVGDEVRQGQVLATLAEIPELEQKVRDQELAVSQARATLNDLTTHAQARLAQALVDQTSAEADYVEALANLHRKGDSRCAPSKTQDYYFVYLYAQQAVDEWESYLNDPNTGYGRDYILKNLTPLRKTRDQAYSNWTYCQSYTEEEIISSEAAMQLAKAKFDQAAIEYRELLAVAGIDPKQVEIARVDLQNAELQLEKARLNLEGATIVSPIAGTVMVVNGEVGQASGTGVMIQIADLTSQQVQVYVDETDLGNFAAGCAAQVSFDSLAGQVFSGTVTQVSPKLVTVSGVDMVEGMIELETLETTSGKLLMPGLSASVEITCHQASDVLLVSTQALYETSGQPVYVYVLNNQDQAEKREIEVGIKTVATAEVLSGLEEGERVITSAVETSQD